MENAPGEGGVEGPEGSWELVAAGSASNRSWRRPGGGPEAQKIHVAPPGGLLGRKVDRFQLPGGGPGAPRSLPESLSESIFEASFLGAPPGTKKV